MSFKERFLRSFPMPHYLEMPAVGIDISDASIKFVEFVKHKEGFRLGRFGTKEVPEGIVVSGDIKDPSALSKILKEIKDEYGFTFIRASLPEERGYLFEAVIPKVKEYELRESLRFVLESNVPVSPEDAVFDYEYVETVSKREESGGQMARVVVSSFAIHDVDRYLQLFLDSGLTPLSFEIEAQALTRSVVAQNDHATQLIVDIGRARSGVSVVRKGVVHFTTTIDVGGDHLTEGLQKEFPDLDPKQIENRKTEEGLRNVQAKIFLERVDELRNEIDKHIVYWQTHSELLKQEHIEKVLLCGGNANISGLPEYLTRSLHIPTSRANVWKNAFSIEEVIPPISLHQSLGFAPAIGLALHRNT